MQISDSSLKKETGFNYKHKAVDVLLTKLRQQMQKET